MDAKFRSLSKQAADCQRHIYRINNVDSINVHEEVANLIRNDVRQLERDIQSVKLLADEEDRQATKNQILNRLGEYETQYRQLQTTSRQAILKSKQRIQKKEQETREALFGRKQSDGSSFTEEYELRQRKARGNDDSLLQATSSVTEALQRTSTLMQQELEKSSYSASALAESSRTLSGTLSEYDNLGSLLTISKRMITQLETSDWFDRFVLLFGVGIFCLVVVYIIKKRTYDVGKSWIFWIGSSALQKSATVASSAGPTSLVPTIADSIPSPTTTLIADPPSLVSSSLFVSPIVDSSTSLSSSLPTTTSTSSLVMESLSSSSTTLVESLIPTLTSVISTWKEEL